MGSLKEKAASGLKWQAVEIAGRQFLALFVFTVLARLLDQEAFGLLGMLMVYLVFAGMLAEQGIGTAIIQRKDLEPKHLDAAFWFNVGCASFLTLATVLLAGPIAVLFDEPKLAPLLQVGSLILVLNSLSGIQAAMLMKQMDFRRPAVRTLIAQLCGGGVGVGLAIAGYGVWALVWQQLTATLVATVLLWQLSAWRPGFTFSFKHLRDLLAVSTAMLVNSLLWAFSTRIDRFFIGRTLGVVPLGEYTMAARIPELAQQALLTPAMRVATAGFAQIQDDIDRMTRAVREGMRSIAAVLIPAFTGLMVTGGTLIIVLFGEKWSSSAPMLRLIAAQSLILALTLFFNPIMISTGRAKAFVVFLLINALLTTGVVLVLLPFGMQAMLIGFIVHTLVVSAGMVLWISWDVGIPAGAFFRPCVAPGLASAVMAGAVLGVAHLAGGAPAWASLIAQITTGVVIYAAALVVIDKPTLMHLLKSAKMLVPKAAST